MRLDVIERTVYILMEGFPPHVLRVSASIFTTLAFSLNLQPLEPFSKLGQF